MLNFGGVIRKIPHKNNQKTYPGGFFCERKIPMVSCKGWSSFVERIQRFYDTVDD